jgi:hypothetical protein
VHIQYVRCCNRIWKSSYLKEKNEITVKEKQIRNKIIKIKRYIFSEGSVNVIMGLGELKEKWYNKILKNI